MNTGVSSYLFDSNMNIRQLQLADPSASCLYVNGKASGP